ncbi:MAG TPA: cobalamin-independent methionine synthase II family protein [Rhizomicrobium sp.]|nr:cobalamin-independent methionine synthase II family protein [Rhizomicrobium sp.]
MTGRILTTHAGSLPKSKELSALHAARAQGKEVDAEAFERQVETAQAAVIARQIESGVDIVGDGEVGREGFFSYIRHRMSGFGGASPRRPMRDITMYPSFLEFIMRATSRDQVSLLAPPAATGAVAYRGGEAIAQDCTRLKRLLRPHAGRYSGAFLTAPSPGIVAAAMQNQFYPDMAAYIGALADALAHEYRAIADSGFILQIDAPDLAMERHTLFADKPLGDFLDFVKLVIAALNGALAGIPRERVRLHVCWGNYNGPHECDVALADIWPEIAKANVGGFLISLANPRHEHETALFANGVLPATATLAAGVIDTTTNYVEHEEVVASRLERAAKAVGDPARVQACTDCGFETSAGYVMIPEDVVWAKLRALRDGAALASRRLFEKI